MIKKSEKSGQYWFPIVASNGQVLASSEQYAAKQSAKDAIASIRRSAADAAADDD
ncbi:MAG: YegP family protein [Jatrophihabitantaceae bacterium]